MNKVKGEIQVSYKSIPESVWSIKSSEIHKCYIQSTTHWKLERWKTNAVLWILYLQIYGS